MVRSVGGRTVGLCCKKNSEWIPFLQSVAGVGFGYVELSLDEAGCRSLLHDAALVERIRELLQSANAGASIHGVGGTNLAEKVGRIRQASIDLVHESVDVAASIGAAWVTVHLGSAGISNGDRARKRDRLDIAIAALDEILRRTVGSPVRLAIENLPRLPDEWPVCRLGDRWEEFEYVFDRMSSARVGMIFDFGHARISRDAGSQFASMPPTLAHRLTAFHLHGNDGAEDRHESLGAADADELTRFLAAAADIPAEAPLLLENYSLGEMLASWDTLSAIASSRVTARRERNQSA